MRRRVSFREADAARPAALGELVAEPALPDAGISRHPDDLARACEGAGERRLERLHLLVAADETREATRPGGFEAGADRSEPLELVDQYRLTDAFQLEPPEVAEPEEPRDEGRGVLGQVDPLGPGELLHALGEPDGVALRGVIHAEVVADPADHDLPGIQPHAHREAEAEPALQLLAVAAERFREV